MPTPVVSEHVRVPSCQSVYYSDRRVVRMLLLALSGRGRGGEWPRSAPTGPCGPRAHSGCRSSARDRRRAGPRAMAHRCASPRACPQAAAADRRWDAPDAEPPAAPTPRSEPRRSRSARRYQARRGRESVRVSRDQAVPAADAAPGAPDGRDEPPLGAGGATATSAGGAHARRPRAPPRAAAGAALRARSAR
jgi:hypothetical protein